MSLCGNGLNFLFFILEIVDKCIDFLYTIVAGQYKLLKKGRIFKFILLNAKKNAKVHGKIINRKKARFTCNYTWIFQPFT